jgi:hypothetical protein
MMVERTLLGDSSRKEKIFLKELFQQIFKYHFDWKNFIIHRESIQEHH